MNRGEIAGRTGQSGLPDAGFNEDHAPRDAAGDTYEGRVMDRLQAPRFFDPASVRWYRSVFTERNPGRDRDPGDVEFLHERGLVVESGDRLVPTRAAVLVFGRPRYVLQVLPRPVIDCQFIGAAYDEWSTDLGWTDRIVVEENLLQTWLTLVERYFGHAERPFSLDIGTMSRDDDPPGYASFRKRSSTSSSTRITAITGECPSLASIATGRCSGTRATATPRPAVCWTGRRRRSATR